MCVIYAISLLLAFLHQCFHLKLVLPSWFFLCLIFWVMRIPFFVLGVWERAVRWLIPHSLCVP